MHAFLEGWPSFLCSVEEGDAQEWCLRLQPESLRGIQVHLVGGNNTSGWMALDIPIDFMLFRHVASFIPHVYCISILLLSHFSADIIDSM